jgi:hypothetical protein
MVFDWAVGNIYAADVTVNGASLISFDVICCDTPPLEKWKVTDRSLALMIGNTQITNFECDRGWYALMIQSLAGGAADIDDVTFKSGAFDLISDEYPALNAEYLNRAEYAPRTAGDTVLQFRPHINMSTDLKMLEGTAARTICEMLIAHADASRQVTTPEVVAPPIAGLVQPLISQGITTATSPVVTGGSMLTQGGITQVRQPGILPVKLNISY